MCAELCKTAGVAWDYYDSEEIKKVEEAYLPVRGEGETMATQITTAIAKLVYKWYNDGDTYDNVHAMKGWCNDLSSYANWLARHIDGAEEILNGIFEISGSERECSNQYENLLKELCDRFQTMEFLEKYKNVPKVGTVYDCDGPYVFDDSPEEEEDDWDDEEEED